jgi:hypothetical protein
MNAQDWGVVANISICGVELKNFALWSSLVNGLTRNVVELCHHFCTFEEST